jgi:hypothetical protein
MLIGEGLTVQMTNLRAARRLVVVGLGGLNVQTFEASGLGLQVLSPAMDWAAGSGDSNQDFDFEEGGLVEVGVKLVGSLETSMAEVELVVAVAAV